MNEFTINQFTTVLLENEKNIIYIIGDWFNQCKYFQFLKGSKAYQVRGPIFSKVKKFVMEEVDDDMKKGISHFKHGNVFDISLSNFKILQNNSKFFSIISTIILLFFSSSQLF